MAGTSNGAHGRSAGVAARAAVEEPVVHHVQPIAIFVPDDQIVVCRYRECKRNHAAAYGRQAVDGCGEFVCNANDPYACDACGCHRSFHRKDAPDVNNYRNPAAVSAAITASVRRPAPPAPQPMAGQALPPMRLATHNGVVTGGGSKVMKKGKRAMLTKEQKMKMVAFAKKNGWRSRRQDAKEINNFCDGIGITKRVFVVWLNNKKRGRNKNGYA